MKNLIAFLSATTVLTMATAAFAADETAADNSKVRYKDNGGYESTQSSDHTTPGGTSETSKTEVDVDVNSKGQVSKTVESKTTTDAKGLLNARTDKAKTELDEKDRGGYKQTSTRSHTDHDGTNVSEKATTDVDVDKTGNVTETTKTSKTVDPKGLMNKHTTTTKAKVVNGAVVETKESK